MRKTDKLLKGTTSATAAIAAVPLFLADSDVNATVISSVIPQDFGPNDQWAVSFNSAGGNPVVGSVYFLSTNSLTGRLFASWYSPMSFFGGSYSSTFGRFEAFSTSPGALINASLPFYDFAQFPQTSPETLYGFVITENFGSGDVAFYGWAEISTSGLELTVHSWGVEDTPNLGIEAGSFTSVPEPAATATGLGALAIGAAAVSRMRRKRKQAKVTE